MKKLLSKLIIFAAPFILLFAIVLLVDPYNYFGYFSFKSIPNDLKGKISDPLNRTLGKIITYSKNPCPKIILGDSRADLLAAKSIKKISNEDFYNLAYWGSSLEEICRTFWWAADLIKLEVVYIGINFNLYNAYHLRERVSGSIAMLENPLLYLINRNVINATFKILKSILTQKVVEIEEQRTIMSKEAFWNYMLTVRAKAFYEHYSYPSSLYAELQKIVRYCRENRIQIFFLILPTHVSMQEKIKKFGLEKEHRRFLADLQTLGIVYDFDYPNEITEDQNNFFDPNHCQYEVIPLLIKQIWGGKDGFGKIYTHDT